MIRHTLIVAMLGFLCFGPVVSANKGESPRGMVSTVHPLATDAAVRVMEEGGNAIDAAVAAAFMLGVVDGHNSGIGGGCFMLVRLADGTVLALDGREMAPQGAHRDMYIRDGEPRTDLSQLGALASGIPGSVAVYEYVVREHGSKPWRELILPAAEVAEAGFPIDHAYATRLANQAENLAKFEASARVMLKDDGRPYEHQEVLRQQDLAASYRALAEQGSDWFYRGEFAQAVEQWMRENGGIITAEDFARYEMKQREALRTTYRGHEIIGYPPPSSGGIHVAQILQMMEHFDIKALHEQDPALRVHVMAEAMKLAFADRAHWLGDSDFVNVPRGLIDPQYTAELARRIDPEAVIRVESHGTPPRAEEDVFGMTKDEGRMMKQRAVTSASAGASPFDFSHLERHTTHLATADAEGNFVAITATLNTAFGSKVIIPGTGVLMNNQMDDFSIQPGVPNVFGLVGADANAIEPGKRPLSSMSPTIVLRDGEPIMTLGAAGGPRIITQVVLAVSNQVDLGMSLPEAIEAMRFHHQWLPDALFMEEGTDEQLQEAMRQRGHEVRLIDAAGRTQAIRFDPDREVFIGVADPRVEGSSRGPGGE